MLWEHDRPVVLQDVSGVEGLSLCSANDINQRGQITGQGTDVSTGDSVAFLAKPTHR